MHRHHPGSSTRHPLPTALAAPGPQRLTLAEMLAVQDAERRRHQENLQLQLPLPEYR